MSPIAASYRRRFAAAPSAVGPRGLPRPLGLTFCMNMFTHISYGPLSTATGDSRRRSPPPVVRWQLRALRVARAVRPGVRFRRDLPLCVALEPRGSIDRDSTRQRCGRRVDHVRRRRLPDCRGATAHQEPRGIVRPRNAGVAVEGGDAHRRPSDCTARSPVRRCRTQPISRAGPPRAVPDAAPGMAGPIHRAPRTRQRLRGRLTMRIVIPGGTGQVGSLLARTFHRQGHDVVVLSRSPRSRPWREVAWDGRTVAGWVREIDGCDVVINLAGRSVNCRYTEVNRREILESRLFSTRAVGQAIAVSNRPPRVWLQASTATIYSHRYAAPNDEASGILGGDEASAPSSWRFSIEVARAWERALDEAATPLTRKVALRSSMIMSPDAGGIFDTLLGLVRCGLGGIAGDGRQFISWIHYTDFVRAVRWLIDHDELDGIVNV